jgi:hypothetical protein
VISLTACKSRNEGFSKEKRKEMSHINENLEGIPG